MSFTQTTTPLLRMRLAAIFLGGIILFWLPIEDTSETLSLLFAIAISTWLATALLVRQPKPLKNPLLKHTLAGIFAGMVVTPFTLILMIFKTGLHSHQTPDFTPAQIISVFHRTPIWIAGGFLIGLGTGVWQANRPTELQNGDL